VAWTFVSQLTGSSSNINSATASPVSLVIPASVQAGDVGIVVFQHALADTTMPTPPTGWTVSQGPVVGGSLTVFLLRKVLDATDAGATVSVTYTATGNAHVSLVGVVVRGADATTPVNIRASRVETASSASHTTPTVNSTVDGCYVLQILAAKDSTATTVTAPGMTVRSQAFSGGLGQTDVTIAESSANAPAGSVGGGSFTADVATINAVMFTVVLQPALVYIRPAGDDYTTGLTKFPTTAATFYSVISEPDPATSDGVDWPTNPAGQILREFFGTKTAWAGKTGGTVHVVWDFQASSSQSFTVKLFQGGAAVVGAGTQVGATWTVTATAGAQSYDLPVSQAQIDQVNAGTGDLHLEFAATAS